MNRRQLLQAGLIAAAGGMLCEASADETSPNETKPAADAKSLQDRICLFTDLIDDSEYSYAEIASFLEQLKIAGADLTVRSGGVVPPDRVVDELPKVAAALRDRGLSIPMLSTQIASANDATTKNILTAMQQLGIRYYKLGYFPYGELPQWESRINEVRGQLNDLIQLGAPLEVVAGIHNHAGPSVGAAMWDLDMLLEPLNQQWVGSYFDPAHATIEGGEFGWKLGFQRLSKRIKMISIKDFVWVKGDQGWRPRWCPLGEGMVRWDEFFSLLKTISFDGPISLHIEYDPGGSTRAQRLENSLAAAERDLKFLRQKIDEAWRRG